MPRRLGHCPEAVCLEQFYLSSEEKQIRRQEDIILFREIIFIEKIELKLYNIVILNINIMYYSICVYYRMCYRVKAIMKTLWRRKFGV